MKVLEVLYQVRETLGQEDKVIFDKALDNIIKTAKYSIRQRIIQRNRYSKIRSRAVLEDIKRINKYTTKFKLHFEEENLALAEEQIVTIIREVVEDLS